ncbi:hypothetical protein ACH5RR_040853 [Cinchona calisaya]|uniref:Peptidase A1 domain-containing protein n=1 Tax=Cinchona calisaya TaxID=153742 RepID=A0ABD2XTV8_9GENT
MAGNSAFSPIFSTLSLLIIIHLFCFPVSKGKYDGFSIDLIHRYHTKSPFHNPSISNFQRLNKAFHRSFSRAAYFKERTSHAHSKHALDSSEPIQSHITSNNNGEYLMKVSIGTPPFDILAIADTGSDLTWTQCKPCSQCYKQDAPLFDPRKTSTYRKLSCESESCEDVGTSNCDDGNNCEYKLSYGDSSYSIGSLAADTFTFEPSSGKNVSIPRVVFGCGHQNAGTFNGSGSGIVGLGGGAVSIVKQFSKLIGGKFSYCLTPIDSNVSSKINFGRSAVVSGPKAVSTPLIEKTPDTFYYLNLEGISVGNNRISKKSFTNQDNSTSDDEGNIIIDSGTTLTFLPREFYDDLESTLKETINGQRISDPNNLLDLCYKLEEDIKFPEIIYHFTDADLVLPPTSTFLEVSEGLICLTTVPADNIAIFGNLSQMDFLIGYDLVNKKVTFLPTDCTKH